MLPQIIHILRFCSRLAAPDFVRKCTEARAVRWPGIFLRVSYIIALAEEQMMHRMSGYIDTARGKDNG